MENLYYKPSGRFTLLGIVFYLLVGAVAASVLSFVYVFAVWFIPFIYINFFLTVGFGAILGLILNYPIKIGKIRNPTVAILLGLTVGLVAMYLQWAVYQTLLFNMGEVLSFGSGRRGFSFAKTSFDLDVFLALLSNPGEVFSFMNELSIAGSWTIFGITPKGFFLWSVWVIEGLMIVGFPMILSFSRSEEPYSELLDKWLKERDFDGKLSFIEDTEKLCKGFESSDFSYITQQDHSLESVEKYARLTMFADEMDRDHIYITLRNVIKGVDKEGKEKEDDKIVIQNFNIPFSVYQSLTQRLDYKPQMDSERI